VDELRRWVDELIAELAPQNDEYGALRCPRWRGPLGAHMASTSPGSYGAVAAYVRTVKTSSGAIAVRVVWSSRRGSRSIEHLGSAHDESELEALKAAARQRLVEGQGEFDLGLDASGIAGGPLEIVSSRARHLWDALCWVL
jgi:hypothetical protein